MDRIKGKLQGGTLVEAMVSMALLLFFALLVFSVLQRINTGRQPSMIFECQLKAMEIINDCKENGNIKNEKWDLQHLTINKNVLLLDKSKNLYLIQLDFIDNNEKELYAHKEAIEIFEK